MAIKPPSFNVAPMSPGSIPIDRGESPLDKVFDLGSSLLQARYRNKLVSERQRETAKFRSDLQRRAQIEQARAEGLLAPVEDVRARIDELGGRVEGFDPSEAEPQQVIEDPITGQEYATTGRLDAIQSALRGQQPRRTIRGRPTTRSVTEPRFEELPRELDPGSDFPLLPDEAFVAKHPDEIGPPTVVQTGEDRRRPTVAETPTDEMTQEDINRITQGQLEETRAAIESLPEGEQKDALMGQLNAFAQDEFTVAEEQRLREDLSGLTTTIDTFQGLEDEGLGVGVLETIGKATRTNRNEYKIKAGDEWDRPSQRMALGGALQDFKFLLQQKGLWGQIDPELKQAGLQFNNNSTRADAGLGRFSVAKDATTAIGTESANTIAETDNAARSLYSLMDPRDDLQDLKDEIRRAGSTGSFRPAAISNYLTSNIGKASRLRAAFALRGAGFTNTRQIQEEIDKGVELPWPKSGIGEMYDRLWDADNAGFRHGGDGGGAAGAGRQPESEGGVTFGLEDETAGQIRNMLADRFDNVAGERGVGTAANLAGQLTRRSTVVDLLTRQAQVLEDAGRDEAAHRIRSIVVAYEDPQNGQTAFDKTWGPEILWPAVDSTDADLRAAR